MLQKALSHVWKKAACSVLLLCMVDDSAGQWYAVLHCVLDDECMVECWWTGFDLGSYSIC